MPCLQIQTNRHISGPAAAALLKELSHTVAEALGKPEKYVMTSISTDLAMTMSGSTANCVIADLSGLGMPELKIPDIAKELNRILSDHLGVPGSRIYLRFYDHPRTHWAMDGKPFA